jgi:hypothetical protein
VTHASVAVCVAVGVAFLSATRATAPSRVAAAQGSSAVVQEKRNRTAAQKKIDTQLLYALYRERGDAEAKGVPAGELRVTFDAKRRALVSIRARVTPSLLTTVKTLGGEVVSSSAPYSDIRAYLPLGKLEDLAALPDVRAIAPADEATTHRAKAPRAGAQ